VKPINPNIPRVLASSDDASLGMKLRWYDLSFKGDNHHLEQPFRESFSKNSIGHTRLGIAFGTILISMFGMLDVMMVTENLAEILFIRYGILCPLAIASLAITYSNWFLRNMQVMMTGIVVFSGVNLIAIHAFTPEPTSFTYFAGAMLVIFFGYAFLRIRFFHATIAGWSIVMIYQTTAVWIDPTPFGILLNNQFFYIGANAIGMFTAYSTEYYARRDFFLVDVLSGKNSEIAAARDELEERVIERTKEAMAGLKSKSDFLANMSHEIRTPMNGVLGMLDLLRNTQLQNEQVSFVDTAYNSAEGLLGIIDGVLDLSKIEAGKMELNLTPTSPAKVIEETCTLLIHQSRDKKLHLIPILDPQAFVSYRLDATRFRQVLLNLLGNALKFTSRGSVTISCELCGSESQPILRIAVTDTGIGISEDKLNSLFDAFTQAENSTSRRFGGTGLGLAISRQLINLMKGEISVSSKPNKGSCFTVTLPVQPADGKTDFLQRPQLQAQSLRVHVHIELLSLSESIALLLQTLGCQVVDVNQAEVVVTNDPDFSSVSARTILITDHLTGQVQADFSATLVQPVLLDNLSAALALKPAVTEDTAKANQRTRFTGSRVLLVEDNEINQKVASTMLALFGVDYHVASGGAEALEAIDDTSYDLILMDCQMPGMDGFETTRVIRDDEQERHIEPSIIVALTANAMEGDRQRCLDSGMDDYLAKPINMSSIEQVLQRWLAAPAGTNPN